MREAAPAGVEGLVVLEDGDGGLDGVDGGGPVLEQGVADGESVGDAVAVGVEHVVGDCPGSAVDEEGWGSWHGSYFRTESENFLVRGGLAARDESET